MLPSAALCFDLLLFDCLRHRQAIIMQRITNATPATTPITTCFHQTATSAVAIQCENVYKYNEYWHQAWEAYQYFTTKSWSSLELCYAGAFVTTLSFLGYNANIYGKLTDSIYRPHIADDTSTDLSSRSYTDLIADCPVQVIQLMLKLRRIHLIYST